MGLLENLHDKLLKKKQELEVEYAKKKKAKEEKIIQTDDILID